MSYFKANAPNSISAGVLPQSPLGNLQRSPDPLTRFKGPTSKGGEGRGGERARKGRGGGRKARDAGKGKGKGEIRDRGRGGSGRRMGFTHPLFSA